jgi:hypothetical protein
LESRLGRGIEFYLDNVDILSRRHHDVRHPHGLAHLRAGPIMQQAEDDEQQAVVVGLAALLVGQNRPASTPRHHLGHSQ